MQRLLASVTAERASAMAAFADLLRSPTGLYAMLGLAVVAVGLAVWAVGSLVANDDEDLEQRLSGYGGVSAAEDEPAEGLGRSGLYRRAVAAIEALIAGRSILTRLERLLEKADVPFRPAEALLATGAASVLIVALALIAIGDVAVVLLVAAVSAMLPVAYLKLKAFRRQRAFESQLPDALQLLAGTLRAGYSLPQGMEAVSHEIADPMGIELRRVMTEARLGRELEEALEAAAQRLESPDFGWAVMAIGIQREVGGNLNELLMTVSDTMVARERLRGEVKALTAEGRMSAVILGGMPPVLALVMWVLNPEYINKLFAESMGHVLIGLALVSVSVGLLWMKKVITINV